MTQIKLAHVIFALMWILLRLINNIVFVPLIYITLGLCLCIPWASLPNSFVNGVVHITEFSPVNKRSKDRFAPVLG